MDHTDPQFIKKPKMTSRGHSPFDNLPPEIVTCVFARLEAKDLGRISRVNSRWNQMASNNQVWSALVAREQGGAFSFIEFLIAEPNPSVANWKDAYKMYSQFHWMSDKSAACSELLEKATEHLEYLCRVGKDLCTKELFWIYSIAFSHKDETDLYMSICAKRMHNLATFVMKSCEEEDVQLCQIFTTGCRRYKKLSTILTTIFCKNDPDFVDKFTKKNRAIFSEVVLMPLKSRLEKQTGYASTVDLMKLRQEIASIYLQYGHEFYGVAQSHEVPAPKAASQPMKGLLFQTQDNVMVHDSANVLAQMSPVIRNLLAAASNRK